LFRSPSLKSLSPPLEGEEKRRVKERRIRGPHKYIVGSFRGTKSLFRKNPPLPLDKGKGIQGMGLTKTEGED